MAAGKYMSIGQVATRFGVSVRTVKNWYLSGRTALEVWCPAHLIGTTGLRFTKKSVEVFESQGQRKPQDYTE
jgi:transposase